VSGDSQSYIAISGQIWGRIEVYRLPLSSTCLTLWRCFFTGIQPCIDAAAQVTACDGPTWRDRLTGIVEFDETYLGSEKPGKLGRGAEEKTLVVITEQVKEENIGRIRLHWVADASVGSLEPVVQQALVPGTIVRTDGWRGYNRLSVLGYTHEMVRKNADVGDNLLPCCDRVAALLKQWLMGTHQGAVSYDHLDYYLDEYTFRFDRHTSRYRGRLFYRLFNRRWLLTQCDTQISSRTRRDQRPKHTTYRGWLS
jgi:transposase-like protein